MHLHTVSTDHMLSFALVASVEGIRKLISESVVALLVGLKNIVSTLNRRGRRYYHCNVRNEFATATHILYHVLQFVVNEYFAVNNLTLKLVINNTAKDTALIRGSAFKTALAHKT